MDWKQYLPLLLLPFAFLGIMQADVFSKLSTGQKIQMTTEKPISKKNLKIGRMRVSGYKNPLKVTLDINLEPYTEAITHPFSTPSAIDSFYKLSISGNIWDPMLTDAISVGQNNDTIREAVNENRFVYDAGYKKEDILKLLDIWDNYHLNNLRSGTKKQTDAVREFREKNKITEWAYEKECDYLKSIDLYEDDGYKYDTEWLFEPLPRHITLWVILFAEGKL